MSELPACLKGMRSHVAVREKKTGPEGPVLGMYLWGLNHTDYPAGKAFGGWGLDFLPPPAAGHEATIARSVGSVACERLNRGIFVELHNTFESNVLTAHAQMLLHARSISRYARFIAKGGAL